MSGAFQEPAAPGLEALFERYRTGGDLAALGAVFDRVAPELLSVAAHLVRDAAEAEDLVQATFVAAIEGAGTFDRARRLEPWLAGILAKQAARAWRERGRRVDPARLPERDAGDPAQSAEARELEQELARALAGLSEPYRSVLERHLVAEETPLAIARATGRAPGTVRMQLLRGLERLGRALPAGLHGLALVRVPRGLAALRAEVLRGAALAPSAGTGIGIGGALMTSKTLAAVGAAVVLGLVTLWSLRREPGASAGEASEVAQATPARAAALRELAPGAPEGARVPAAEAAAAERTSEASVGSAGAAPAPGLWLVGRLLGLDDRKPQEVGIAVSSIRGESAGGQGRPDGSYAVELSSFLAGEHAPAALYVTAAHPENRKVSLEVRLPDTLVAAARRGRAELTLDLELVARTLLVGRVELAPSIHPYDTRVDVAVPRADGGADLLQSVDVDPDGAFELTVPGGGELLVVARNFSVPPLERRVLAREDEVTDVGTLRLEPGGASIEGVLRLPFAGEVFPFALRAVHVHEDDGEQQAEHEGWVRSSAGLELEEQRAKVRVDGAFSIGGLAPGTYDLYLDRDQARESVLPQRLARVVAPAANVQLGAELGRVEVIALGADGAEVQVSIPVMGGALMGGCTAVQPFTLLCDRREALVIEVRAAGFEPAQREFAAGSLRAEERVELALVPVGGRAGLELTWTLPAGVAAPEWVALSLREEGADERTVHARADARGCRFSDLAPGHYRAEFEPRGPDFWERASFLVAEGAELVLSAGASARHDLTWSIGGGVRFVPDVGPRAPEVLDARILDGWGRELPVRFVTRTFQDGSITYGTRTGTIDLREPSELEPMLVSGSYELVLTEDDVDVARVPFAVAAGAIAEVPFTLD